MRSIVTDQLKRTAVVTGDDFDAAIGDGIGQVAQLAIERNGDSLLGQRLRNRLGDVAPGRARGVFADGAIGKCKGNGIRHHDLLSSPANECGWYGVV
ncbi:hypothetical protein D3C72_2006610 [compost metagenome]